MRAIYQRATMVAVCMFGLSTPFHAATTAYVETKASLDNAWTAAVSVLTEYYTVAAISKESGRLTSTTFDASMSECRCDSMVGMSQQRNGVVTITVTRAKPQDGQEPQTLIGVHVSCSGFGHTTVGVLSAKGDHRIECDSEGVIERRLTAGIEKALASPPIAKPDVSAK